MGKVKFKFAFMKIKELENFEINGIIQNVHNKGMIEFENDYHETLIYF